MSILNGPIWSKCSIAPTYPFRSHFQRALSRERRCQGWDERCRSSIEEYRQERHKRRGEKTIDRPLGDLVRSFRGQHGEIMGLNEEGAQDNWDPWEGQQPFQPYPNGVRDRTTTLML